MKPWPTDLSEYFESALLQQTVALVGCAIMILMTVVDL